MEGVDEFEIFGYSTCILKTNLSTAFSEKISDNASVLSQGGLPSRTNRRTKKNYTWSKFQEYVKKGTEGGKIVCRLNDSIYELKQAAKIRSRSWYVF